MRVPAGTTQTIHATIDTQQEYHYEWHIEPHATLTLVQYQMVPMDLAFTATMHFIMQEGSLLRYAPILHGASHSSLSITVSLAQNASAQIAGAYAFAEQQTGSIITRQEHHGKASRSSLVINGIAADESKVSYSGTIAIGKNASKAIAQQENKTILLGSRASALSIPSLEVETNDVQCAHGSAVGPLPQEQIMYACSRGMHYDQARHLLLASFFTHALDGILIDKEMHDQIVAQLVTKAIAKGVV